MPPVMNHSHVGVLTPLYTGIHSKNFNQRATLVVARTIKPSKSNHHYQWVQWPVPMIPWS
jgi:hypothetical protein